MNALITGATGNVGFSVIEKLSKFRPTISIIAGVRNLEKARACFAALADIELRLFDFENESSFDEALNDIDIVFLLRPPHLSDVDRYFAPLIRLIAGKGITKIVFLSVQGAEQSKIIPHRKIELLIQESGLNYIFLRPSYFMQNLTTTLKSEIENERTITLPSGRAKFNWVDVNDIGEIAAELMSSFESHRNKALVISGKENLNFSRVVEKINRICSTNIAYRSIGPVGYYRLKKKAGMKTGMIFVTFMLHFLPRLQKEPEIVCSIRTILGREPKSIEEFILSNKKRFV